MLSAPAPLAAGHDLELFRSGAESLDQWLRHRARANDVSGASRTYVAAEGTRVVGYFRLSSGGLDLVEAPGAIRRNMPNPIPMIVLGRLAVDVGWQGRGLGAALLRDAVLRASHAATILGVRGIFVHAVSHEAKAFYEHYGFAASPKNPMTLVLSLKGALKR